MESPTSALFEHTFPHKHFSSRIAYGDTKRIHSFPSKRSTRLPPIIRAANDTKSADTESLSSNSIGDCSDVCDEVCDSKVKVKQLERNLTFVKEHCHVILKALHKEIDELKSKNKELHFKLIVGNSAIGQQLPQKSQQLLMIPLPNGALPHEIVEHIKKLEAEIKRIRYALGETLKMNAALRSELIKLKKGPKPDESSDDERKSANKSPPIEDFCETLKQITTPLKKQSAFLPNIKNT